MRNNCSPEMGYARTAVIKAGRIYTTGNIVFWGRKGYKRNGQVFLPDSIPVTERKSSRRVDRFWQYMALEGLRKPIRYSPATLKR